MLKKISLLFVLLSGVFWGSSPLFVNYLTELGFDSFQCTAIRIVIAAPLLHICLLISGRSNYKMPIKAFAYLAICGVGSVLTMCVCYYCSMTLTSAAVSAVLLYTSPIFVMIMSVIFFKERFTVKKGTALLLAVIGCALTSGIIGGLTGSLLGVVFGILSGFAYSLYGIFSTFALRLGVSPLACTTFSFTFAAIAALFITNPISLVSEIIAFSGEPLKILILPLFSICTAIIPYMLYTVGLTNVKPDIAAIAASTEPVVCALIGVFILNQSVSVFQVIGIALVISAIVILNLNIRNSKKSAE